MSPQASLHFTAGNYRYCNNSLYVKFLILTLVWTFSILFTIFKQVNTVTEVRLSFVQ